MHFESVTVGPCVLYLADCREIAPTLEGVDVTIADPPYGETALAWDKLIEGWPEAMPGPQLWCFGSLRFFLATTFPSWKIAQEIVWEKHNGSGFQADRFKRVHGRPRHRERRARWHHRDELLVHFYRGEWSALHLEPQVTHDATKRTLRRKQQPAHRGDIGEADYSTLEGGPRLMRSVQYVRSCHGHAIHPTQKPVEIIEPALRYSCPPGGLVFDPFSGSGSVLEAAMRNGRRGIGCENDPDRFAVGVKRLQAAWREQRSRLPLAAG